MAKLSFVATDIDGNDMQIVDIVSYQLSMDWDAACHGLRLNFCTDSAVSELVKICVYNNGKRIFKGYVDTQREQLGTGGTACFIYARSSACILTDNEAMPCIYTTPSALGLYCKNAKDFGFSCDLPRIYSSKEYQVSKGVSCFGAINDFVEGITGKRIGVDADDCISLLQGRYMGAICTDDIVSHIRCINRGDVVTRIDYKTGSAGGFDHHIKSRYFEHRGISTSKKESLSLLPDWQRDNDLLHTLASSAQGYIKHQLVLDGALDYQLGDTVDIRSDHFGSADSLVVRSVCLAMDSSGESTHLTLVQSIDLEEIYYVD